MAITPPSPPTIRFGPFELDAAAAELRKNGTLIKLQPQPLRVLLLLTQRAGQVVTREEIQRCIWSDSTFVDFEHGINFSINQIRAALADNAENPRYIETLPRRGYRFMAPVVGNGAAKPESVAILADSPEPAVSFHQNGVGELPGGESKQWKSRAWILFTVTMILGVGYSVRSWVRAGHKPSLEKIQIAKITDSGNVELVAISPDGRYVCYSLRDRRGSGLWLHHVATGSNTQILPAEAIAFEGLTFSRDGNYIYYVKADKNDPGFKYLYVMPVLGGPSRLLVRDIDSPISFSPDGRKFVYTRGIPVPNNIEIRIANADGGGNYLLATVRNRFPGFQPGATWSPNGKVIAVSSRHYGKQSFTLDIVTVSDGSAHEMYSSSGAIGRPLWLSEGDGLLLVLRDQNGRGQLWTISYPKVELHRVTNDLTDYREIADITRDSKTMIAMEDSVASNVWAAQAGTLSDAKQITSLSPALFSVIETSDRNLLATSLEGNLWKLGGDGSRRTLIAGVSNAVNPTPCGRFVVVSSFGTSTTEIVRFEADGDNFVTLVSGDVRDHVCAADGKYVFYQDLGPPHSILRIPIEGGAPTPVAQVLGEFLVGRLSISRDGKRLAYPYEEYSPTPVLKLAIITAEGSLVKTLTAPGGAYAYGSLLWSPDGKSLQYVLTENGASNIWEQRLDGSEPRQLTTFAAGQIFDFHWSLDGKRLFLSRGEISSDVVELSNLR